MTYKEMTCRRYIAYVEKHYGQNYSITFDRYSDNTSTKGLTHLRCSKGKLDRPVMFTQNTEFIMKKDEFC